MTKPSTQILSSINEARRLDHVHLTLDGGWELGDVQRVLIRLLEYLDEQHAAEPHPWEAWMRKLGEHCEHMAPWTEDCLRCPRKATDAPHRYWFDKAGERAAGHGVIVNRDVKPENDSGPCANCGCSEAKHDHLAPHWKRINPREVGLCGCHKFVSRVEGAAEAKPEPRFTGHDYVMGKGTPVEPRTSAYGFPIAAPVAEPPAEAKPCNGKLTNATGRYGCWLRAGHAGKCKFHTDDGDGEITWPDVAEPPSPVAGEPDAKMLVDALYRRFGPAGFGSVGLGSDPFRQELEKEFEFLKSQLSTATVRISNQQYRNTNLVAVNDTLKSKLASVEAERDRLKVGFQQALDNAKLFQADFDLQVSALAEANARWTKHEEICSGNLDNEDPATELDRLNPFKRQWLKQEVPTEPLASFLHGIRYYAGMLEDDDNWSHGLGHIEELCVEFDKAIHERAGKPYLPRDERLRADLQSWFDAAQTETKRANEANARAERLEGELAEARGSLVTKSLGSVSTAHHPIAAPSQPLQDAQPGEREIKVGSTWRHRRSGAERRVVEFIGKVVWLSTGNDWHVDEFRAGNEWVSDPPAQPVEGVAVGGERAIVVGSTWRYRDSEAVDTVTGIKTERGIWYELPSGEELCPNEALFRREHTWISDPPATPVTREKP